MKNIIDYTIVVSNKGSNLAEKVCALMKDGWQPLGASVLIGIPDWIVVQQTMVKYEQD